MLRFVFLAALLHSPADEPKTAIEVYTVGYSTTAISLHRYPGVAGEIVLTESQSAACEKLGEKYSGMLRSYYELVRERNSGKVPCRNPDFESLVLREYSGELKAVLSQDQHHRIVQISIQLAGVRAFDEPCITQSLSLTPEQRTKIGEIAARTMSRANDLIAKEFGKPSTMKEARRMQDEGTREIRALFTEDQARAWDALVGARFE